MGNWIAYMLGVHGPDQSWPVGLELVPSIGAMLLSLACLILFLFWLIRLYQTETVKISSKLRKGLLAARMLGAFSICILIFQPFACSVKLVGKNPGTVAILLDDSASMQQKDERTQKADLEKVETILGTKVINKTDANQSKNLTEMPSRLQLAKPILEKIMIAREKSEAKKLPFRRFLVGNDFKRMNDDSSPMELDAAWKGEQTRTALAAGISRLLGIPQDLPAAVVALTDGRDTGPGPSLREVAREAGSRGVPLIFVGIGLEQPAFLELRDMVVPDLVLAGETIAVPIRWRTGFFEAEKHPGAKVELRLELDGTEVARETLPARPGEDIRHAMFFKPDVASASKKGSKLAVSARLIGMDESREDSLTRQVQVIDRRVKVLVVEKTPRWDMRFLLMNLTREAVSQENNQTSPRKALEPTFVILEGDKGLTSNQPFLPEFPTTRKDLFAFDTVILGDVPVENLGPEGAERLRQFVEEGGGLLILGGRRHNGMGWTNTPLAELLPVEPAVIEATPTDVRTASFVPTLTPEGSRHDAMRLADSQEASGKIWKDLPGIHWISPVRKIKPGATTLLAHPSSKVGNSPAPLLVTQPYGRGQVAFFGFDEAWRWRYNEGETHFGRFWSQWIYWAAGPKAGAIRQVRLSVDRPDPVLGTLGLISGRILDRNFQPEKRDFIPAKLDWLDAPENLPAEQKVREVLLRAVPDHPGEYTLHLSHDRVGRFALIVPGEPETRLEWRIFAPQDMEKGGMAGDLLKDCAQLSGGAYFREDEGEKVVSLLKYVERPSVVVAEMPRLHPFLFFVIVVALSLEWALRRWNNLS